MQALCQLSYSPGATAVYQRALGRPPVGYRYGSLLPGGGTTLVTLGAEELRWTPGTHCSRQIVRRPRSPDVATHHRRSSSCAAGPARGRPILRYPAGTKHHGPIRPSEDRAEVAGLLGEPRGVPRAATRGFGGRPAAPQAGGP